MPFADKAVGNAYRLRRAHKLVAAGLCLACGQRRRVNSNHCRECQDISNRRVVDSKHQNRDKHNARVREITAIRRAVVFRHYGDRCRCCAETQPLFLTLDHKNGGGRQDRRFKSASGTRLTAAQFYNKVIKLNFPDDLHLLCFNCNCGRSRNGGMCPHVDNSANREWNEFPKVSR